MLRASSAIKALYPVLLLVGVLELAAGLSRAQVVASAAEESWANLIAAEEAPGQLTPPSLGGQEFERFLTEYSQRAGELADRFKAYERQHPGNPHLGEAWEKWMDRVGILGDVVSAPRGRHSENPGGLEIPAPGGL